MYLSQEADFAIFLPDQPYANWEAAEVFPDRVRDLKVEDRVQVGNGVTVDGGRQQNTAKVKKIRTNLRTVLSLVGKCVSQGHYNSVMRHSTSLTGTQVQPATQIYLLCVPPAKPYLTVISSLSNILISFLNIE